MNLVQIIDALACAYGPRGWWPLPSKAGQDGRNPAGYLVSGSVPVGPDAPGPDQNSRRAARFEIAVGAILAQNTAWSGASKAVAALAEHSLLAPKAILEIDVLELATILRPAGTFARKTLYLKTLAAAWPDLDVGTPTRNELLALRGIGHETADCILCYGYGQPRFVADAYARRIAVRCGAATADPDAGLGAGLSYEELRHRAEAELPADARYLAEGHALLVEHAKRHCRVRPLCSGCPLAASCPAAWHSGGSFSATTDIQAGYTSIQDTIL
ncbi:MAG: DNA repair protein [Spirochaetota bacterium]